MDSLDWDRSHDVILIRFWHDLVQIEIQFTQTDPSVPELVAIRPCLPQFRELPPAEVRERVGNSGSLILDPMSPSAAQLLIDLLVKEQLRVVVKDVSC